MELQELVTAIARGIELADKTRPVWTGRTRTYQPGIGPHTESKTLDLAFEHLKLNGTPVPVEREIPYPDVPRSRCDLVVGEPASWAAEVKMLRRMGDNGKPNDNILMHILSPYSKDRSALTDCDKLLASGFECRLAIIIFGYDYEDFPMDPAIDAFQLLAKERATLGEKMCAEFEGLVHPIHLRGRVFGWEILR
jgi:hypothetical protein